MLKKPFYKFCKSSPVLILVARSCAVFTFQDIGFHSRRLCFPLFFSRTLGTFIKANKKQQRDTRASVNVVMKLTNILPAREKSFAHMTVFFFSHRWNLHKLIRAKVASHHGDTIRIRTVPAALEPRVTADSLHG